MTQSVINPKHYEFTLKGYTFQVVDLMEERFPDDAHLSQALKYLMRAGRKSDSSYLKDVGKCLWWCARAIMFHGGKYVELPPNTPRQEEIAKPSVKRMSKAAKAAAKS